MPICHTGELGDINILLGCIPMNTLYADMLAWQWNFRNTCTDEIDTNQIDEEIQYQFDTVAEQMP